MGIIPNYNGKYGLPVRVLEIMGKVPHTKKGVATGEYSNRYDHSKYRFFLDAPFEISNKCCTVMKKDPIHKYSKETGRVPITAQMASESRLRTQKWLQNGCNAFDCKNPISNPMSFWTEQDILQYIKIYNLPICSVYGDVVVDYDSIDTIEGQMNIADFLDVDYEENLPLKTTGCSRTGCCLCAFGANCEKREDGRFLLLKETHPKFYALLDLIKNNGITYREAIEWTNKHLPKNRQIWL